MRQFHLQKPRASRNCGVVSTVGPWPEFVIFTAERAEGNRLPLEVCQTVNTDKDVRKKYRIEGRFSPRGAAVFGV